MSVTRGHWRRRKGGVVANLAVTDVMIGVTGLRAPNPASISMGSTPNSWALDELAAMSGGYPAMICVDNGPELISNALDQCASERGVKLVLSARQAGRHAFVESFNGRLRDECLNANWFRSLAEARTLIQRWVKDYNEERPHRALGGLTPIEYERSQIRNREWRRRRGHVPLESSLTHTTKTQFLIRINKGIENTYDKRR